MKELIEMELLQHLDITKIKEYNQLLKDYIKGGKRIRPLLLLNTYQAAGWNDIHKAVSAAIALEYLHTYTLILDDIMDEDELRRGKKTIHASISNEPLPTKLFSDSRSRYGVSNAIMIANLLNIKARELLMNYDKQILRWFNDADRYVYHGQMMDLIMETQDADYLKMVKLKTGTLFALAIKVGAYLAGAYDTGLDGAGYDLGIWFQLKDDLLDISDKKGHEKGSDITKGKKTLLMQKSYELSDDSQKKILDTRNVNEVIDIMHRIGAVSFCENLSEDYKRNALARIDKSKLPTKSILTEFFASL